LAFVEQVSAFVEQVLAFVEQVSAFVEQVLAFVEQVLAFVEQVLAFVEQGTTSNVDVFANSWRLGVRNQISLIQSTTRSARKTRRLVAFQSPEP
jgi:methyl-accepting chemotaxis protein